MKLYYFHIKDITISYPETTNNLAKNPANKPTNKKIPILLDYLEPKRFYQQKQP